MELRKWSNHGEIRSTKSETNSIEQKTKEIFQTTQIWNRCFEISYGLNSFCFFFVSDLELRISDFDFSELITRAAFPISY